MSAQTKLVQRQHTAAVVAALKAVGLAVGHAIRNTNPDGTGPVLKPPCAIVYLIPGGERSGTMDDWNKDATLVYQVTCVGLTYEQAEWVRDQSETLLDLKGTGIVPGRYIDRVEATFGASFGGGDEHRNDSTGSPFFQITPRYAIYSAAVS
ncbi:hypothetical protein [Phytoactinopolyspora limicola]|uniref:hypothetical protein n=1 Tax=Phytoactinopolyspora limicola TaxID=2715536 RepID=UPI00140AAE26|nr:hypothetical protein [Phytoactinopolyspora limicola]